MTTQSGAAPEREHGLRDRVRETNEKQIITPFERTSLKKGMSKKMKIFLASGVAVAGAAAIGGVVGKMKYDAMTPEQKLDLANSLIGRTSWAPWLSGRIRSARDAGVLRELENPNAGSGMNPTERLRLANRVIEATADSPLVSAAVKAKRDQAINAEIRSGWNALSGHAQRLFGATQRVQPNPPKP